MEDSIVIKVVYGNTIRRFNARIIEGKLDLSFNRLRVKLVSLFNFAHDNEVTLTYIDEDGDAVTLADDEDLQDVVNQALNPLRITVTDQVMNAKSKIDEVKPGIVKDVSSSKAPNFFAFESKATTGVGKKDKGKKMDVRSSKTTSHPTKVANNITKGKEDKKPSDVARDPLKGNSSDGRNQCPAGVFGSFHPSSWHSNTWVPTYFGPAFPPHPVFEANPSQKDGSEIIYHQGIRCDGCGVHPITGPRFFSKVKSDYDLCTKCFSKTGKDTDYIKMEHVYQPHLSFQDGDLIPPQVCKGVKIKASASELDSEFIKDINMVDGTTVQPLAPFSKIWRMRNNGKVMWPHKTQLVWVGGYNLSTMSSLDVKIPAPGLMVGQEHDVCVDFIAPQLPGRYVSYWRMASPTGIKFGQRIWVLIKVDASLKKTQLESGVSGLKVNLPHIGSSSGSVSGPQTVNVEPKSIVEPKSTVEDNKANLENLKRKVPQYPLPFHEPAATRLPAFPLKGSERVELGVENKTEESEVRQNEFVIKSSDSNVEAAASVEKDTTSDDEWDTILDDLQDMGFEDVEMNKMLMKKNNGSIKRVVLDLIAREEEK